MNCFTHYLFYHFFVDIIVSAVTMVINRLGVLETWSLGLEMSRDPFLQVLVSVLVLEPQSLGLDLGLGTLVFQSQSWSWDLGP